MIVPAFLLLMSIAVGAYAVYTQGPVLSDPLVLAGLSGAAALILFLRAWIAPPKQWIILDGSNIMYWKGRAPTLDTVRFVVDGLKGNGYKPIIWFDANVGYMVGESYLGPAKLAKILGTRESRVHVSPKGKPADPLLLKQAVKMKARVVSNDTFSDWTKKFPQVKRDGFLVRTDVEDEKLSLHF